MTELAKKSISENTTLFNFNFFKILREFFESKEFTISFPDEEITSNPELYYQIRDYLNIQKFLKNNLFLLDVLYDAPKIIKKYFSSENLVLDLISDSESNYEVLFIFIQTKDDVEIALKKLDKLDEEWFFNLPYNIREKLCVHLEFI